MVVSGVFQKRISERLEELNVSSIKLIVETKIKEVKEIINNRILDTRSMVGKYWETLNVNLGDVHYRQYEDSREYTISGREIEGITREQWYKFSEIFSSYFKDATLQEGYTQGVTSVEKKTIQEKI